tara:strand:- start:982 stop:1125 length:144 start_codon:yes stop_codon:yes gene_type:complete
MILNNKGAANTATPENKTKYEKRLIQKDKQKEQLKGLKLSRLIIGCA